MDTLIRSLQRWLQPVEQFRVPTGVQPELDAGSIAARYTLLAPWKAGLKTTSTLNRTEFPDGYPTV